MNGEIKGKIVSVLNAAFGNLTVNADINESDIPILASVFNRQSLLPFLVNGLRNMGYSDLLTEDLKKKEARAIFDYTQRKTALDEIAYAFESEKISFVPLKGSTLCDLYPEPWMRTSNDIDVLVRAEDLSKAINVLSIKTSFKYLKKESHDVHFINKYVHLELHFSLLSSLYKLDSILLNPWAYIDEKSDLCRCNFTKEFNLVYIIAHTAKHFIKCGGIGIRPILDIFILKTKTKFDEKIVKQLCDKAGILGFYNTCCLLIDAWFYNGKRDDVTVYFEELVLSGGVFGSKDLKLVSNKRKDSGKKYISGRIFKSSEDIKNYYPKCRKHPILVPFYQIVRWAKVFRINKIKSYISEFKQADSIDQSEVDKYDNLLKFMGL